MLAERSAVESRKNSEEYLIKSNRERMAEEISESSSLKLVSRYKKQWRRESALGTIQLCFDSYSPARVHFTEGTAFKTVYLYIVLKSHRDGRRLGGDWNGYLEYAHEMLQTALLGGDPKIESRAIEQARGHTDDDATKPYFKYWHNRVRALAALLEDRPDRARARIDRAEAQLDVLDHDTADVPLELLRGLCDNDTDTIESVATTIADNYAAQWDLPIDLAHGRQLMSFDAATGLALARRRGLDVSIEHDAVPSLVCERDWAHREHELSDLAAEILADVDSDRE